MKRLLYFVVRYILSDLQVHTHKDVAMQTLNYLNQVQHTNNILLFTQIRCLISDMDRFEYAQMTQVPRPHKHPEPLPNVFSTLEASRIFLQMSRYGRVRLSFPKNRSRLQKRGGNMLFTMVVSLQLFRQPSQCSSPKMNWAKSF